MDRAKFLAKLKASAVKLVPLTLRGWEEPIYLKPQTMADIREVLAESNGVENETLAQRLTKDAYFIERGIAKLLHDENGNRLFDIKDDRQLEELRSVLDNNGPAINRQLQDAQNALDSPADDEVDPATKTKENPQGN